MSSDRGPRRRLPVLAVAVGLATCLAAALAAVAAGGDASADLPTEAERAAFARPQRIPLPAGASLAPAVVELGRQLFSDGALSAGGKVACATCHNPLLGLGDGVARGKGVTGVHLPRNTPTLWNVGLNATFFWDGRAASLEAQALGPLTAADEMGSRVEDVLAYLAGSPDYARRFAEAFADRPRPSQETLVAALAAYERTLVSPPTAFDRWLEGDAAALTPRQKAGFRLFTGRARCVLCHEGWTFSDQAFHDIGLPSADRGRGPVAGLPGLEHAFKTPTLRELSWTAPYMHDGSLTTLEAVLDHYTAGIAARPSLSPELRPIRLDAGERAALLDFLGTLSSSDPPQPDAALLAAGGVAIGPEAGTAVPADAVSQQDKRFLPGRVRISRGATLTVLNRDTRPHNVRIEDPRLSFNSGTQEPGQTTAITFEQAGSYEVICGIHPRMRLLVEVAP